MHLPPVSASAWLRRRRKHARDLHARSASVPRSFVHDQGRQRLALDVLAMIRNGLRPGDLLQQGSMSFITLTFFS